jgi:hypothetical protein
MSLTFFTVYLYVAVLSLKGNHEIGKPAQFDGFSYVLMQPMRSSHWRKSIRETGKDYKEDLGKTFV